MDTGIFLLKFCFSSLLFILFFLFIYFIFVSTISSLCKFIKRDYTILQDCHYCKYMKKLHFNSSPMNEMSYSILIFIKKVKAKAVFLSFSTRDICIQYFRLIYIHWYIPCNKRTLYHIRIKIRMLQLQIFV